MDRGTVIDILRTNIYPAVCFLPKDVLDIRCINAGSLEKIRARLTTLHCYRVTHCIVAKLFGNYIDEQVLLTRLYGKRDTQFHVFYIVVFLLVCYFKKTSFDIGNTIVDLLIEIRNVCQNQTPFHDLFIVFLKQNGSYIHIGNTKFSAKKFNFISNVDVSSEFEQLKKMIRQVNNAEWLPSMKTFHNMKSLCNFAFKFPTSNRLLIESDVKMMKSELCYPKSVLDFAYRFREKTISDPSWRRHCFETLRSLLVNPFETYNLSFSQYVINELSFLSNFVSNKVVNLNPAGCFCKTKCVRREEDLETLYSNGLFIICKSCSQPVNYRIAVYNNTQVVNDFHNHDKYFSCIDGCSDFDFLDLYNCSIDERGVISYSYLALVKTNDSSKKRNITSLCDGHRRCFTVVTTELNDSKKPNLSCTWNHQPKDTCFDFMKVLLSDETDSQDVDRNFILQNTCFGCLAYCFDQCTKEDKIKRKIRSILTDKFIRS